MADTSLEGYRFMRDLTADVHTPEHAHAIVITGGRDAAHLALTIVDHSMTRVEKLVQNGELSQEVLASDLAIVVAAIQAWRTVYAYLPR
jgi:DNA-binding transcriptional regulator YiaG